MSYHYGWDLAGDLSELHRRYGSSWNCRCIPRKETMKFRTNEGGHLSIFGLTPNTEYELTKLRWASEGYEWKGDQLYQTGTTTFFALTADGKAVRGVGRYNAHIPVPIEVFRAFEKAGLLNPPPERWTPEPYRWEGDTLVGTQRRYRVVKGPGEDKWIQSDEPVQQINPNVVRAFEKAGLV